MDKEIQLVKSDVTIKAIEELCECEEGPVTDFVWVDYRSAGITVGVGRYCRNCAVDTMERIQDGLPDEPEETEKEIAR